MYSVVMYCCGDVLLVIVFSSLSKNPYTGVSDFQTSFDKYIFVVIYIYIYYLGSINM